VLLQVSSPRRPCERWNEALGNRPPPYDTADGNVRHWCLQHTLGGVFFRVLRAGTMSSGDELHLQSRPHPDWPLKRVGDLMYSQAGVAPEEWGVAWSGTAAELDALIALP
jgi:Uncharacterized protein conserved in bacteria